ncbi:MAG: disulfide bond formation protein B [Rhodospirillaceae bacterium]|nr:disulfide bond formation protein B [Rhodospirillaceae bacterium]MBT4686819.1 disulfide bond formation protein B [Rhodospirillaceae bacterium]MBT5081923.1 disulfide bond formation protein B [Rhodospirillaceae bacterium]MBT5523816.1 disulfide bond formation protein B [Rhodospirillaceae bacterium]MBT5879542.1 disulfide bond formation protein B [Rhodospirillaceae bacterium]
MFAQLFAPKWALILVPLAAVTALALAFIGQYGFDLYPCVLCIYQRWPFVIVAGLCLLAANPAMRTGKAARWILLLCAGVLAVNAAIAVYHVGVEQHWWAGSEACVGKTGATQTLAQLRAQIMSAPVTRCDEIAFSLFGVSMAGYNVLFSFVLALYAGLVGYRAR